MEMGIGFVLGIIFLESTLFIIALWKEELVLYVGIGILYFPIRGICYVYWRLRNFIFHLRYVYCLFYRVNPQTKECQLATYDRIVIPRKDLEKFYWENENNYFIKPVFYKYHPTRQKYVKMKSSYSSFTKLSKHSGNLDFGLNIKMFMRKGNENAD